MRALGASCDTASMRRCLLGLALLLGLCSLGCDLQARAQNVLLITVDTTRADRLGAYGSSSARTPNLDLLAADGTLYERAYAAAPETLPSHSSLMTGLYPPSHGARLNGVTTLDDSVTTLAEILQAEGFYTAAVTAASVLTPDFGLDQGFDVYDAPEDDERRAEAVTQAALEVLGRAGEQRFFLWAHFYDPHNPFAPPEDFRPEGADPESPELYDAEVTYMDHWVGHLLESLREDGRLAETLVVLVADHGESLGDYGETYHTHFIYDATIHVPLFLTGPGIPAGQRIDSPVASLDVFATVLDELDLPVPSGDSVRLPGLRGRPSESSAAVERGLYSETRAPLQRYGWSPLASIRTADWLFIEAPRLELYASPATDRDPNLLGNPTREQVRALQRMQRLLQTTQDGMPAPPTTTRRDQRISEEQRRSLEALGYLSGGGASDLTKKADGLEDPKDMIEVAESISVGLLAMRQEEFELAEQLLGWAVAADPASAGARLRWARALAALGRVNEAYEELLEADRLNPASWETLVDLAAIGEVQGAAEQADLHREAALTLSPLPAQVWLRIARVRLQTGRREQAIEALEETLALDGDHKQARSLLERLRAADDVEAGSSAE